ncbi:ABC transporter permease [Bacillus massilinigeriensis]|uniref:ABC transporter permease n=1 Tax=Bacillus mediterraneensis TaxID=1805474 RepID=UPI0008F918C3|nr:ABC transporter permease [Bacillus mediterraneensis]
MNSSLILFELIKFKKKRKNIVIFSLFLLIVLLFFILNNKMSSTYAESRIQEEKFAIESLQEAIQNLPQDSKVDISSVSESYNSELNLRQDLLRAYQEDNWLVALEKQIMLDQNSLESLDKGNVIGGEPREVVEKRLAINEELLHKKIKPEESYYGTSGIQFLKNILKLGMSFSGLLLSIFLIGDILSNEYEKGTIKYIFTQPISRKKILTTKLIFSVIVLFLIYFTFGLVSFFLGGLYNGDFGNINYPVYVYRNNGYDFISLVELIFSSSLLFFFVILFIVSIVILMSVLTKNSMLTIGFTLLIILLFTFSTEKFTFLYPYNHLIPFSYIDSIQVIDGTISNNSSNFNISLITGILVLSISTLIAVIYTRVLINRSNEI